MLSSELLALGRPRMKHPIRPHQEQNGSWFVAILNDPNFGFGRGSAGSRQVRELWMGFGFGSGQVRLFVSLDGAMVSSTSHSTRLLFHAPFVCYATEEK